jgi:hypothetical protein
MRDRVLCGCLLAAALWPREADAQHLTLAWEAPAGCPDRAAVRARLPEARRPITVRARSVRGANDRWAIHLEIDGGARDLEADTCAELADAAVLIVSLALDGASSDPPTPPAPIRAAPGERVRFGARALGGVDLGTLPAAAFVVSAAVTARAARWRGEVALSWLSSQRRVSPSGFGGDFDAGRVTLRGCFVPFAHRLELRACVGVDVGLLVGAGVGVDAPDVGIAPWVAARLGAEAAWRVLPWLAAVALVDGVAVLERPRFSLRDGTVVHTPEPVGVVMQGGAEFAW